MAFPPARSAALVFFPVLAVATFAGVAACGPPKMPTGPAPEYEDPPAPSWLDGGPAQADGGAGPSGDAGTPDLS